MATITFSIWRLMKENKKLKRYCIDMNEFISINNKVKK